MRGKLFGVGVGPGDPELLTLKAKRILEEADCIAIPKSENGKKSVALSIAEKAVDIDCEILELVFPMSFDGAVLESSWAGSMAEIRKRLNEGKSVAFVTLGDPTVYSTYIYMHKALKAMDYDTEIIPGITSFCAAASRVGVSLGENRESIAIIPSAYECKNLDEVLESFDNVVLMKAAKNLPKLVAKLKEKGLDKSAVLVSKCGFDDELIEYDLEKALQSRLSYFTTMIVKRNEVG